MSVENYRYGLTPMYHDAESFAFHNDADQLMSMSAPSGVETPLWNLSSSAERQALLDKAQVAPQPAATSYANYSVDDGQTSVGRGADNLEYLLAIHQAYAASNIYYSPSSDPTFGINMGQTAFIDRSIAAGRQPTSGGQGNSTATLPAGAAPSGYGQPAAAAPTLPGSGQVLSAEPGAIVVTALYRQPSALGFTDYSNLGMQTVGPYSPGLGGLQPVAYFPLSPNSPLALGGVRQIELTEEAYVHILARHGPGVDTRGNFDPVFFSMGRSGMAALLAPALQTATVTPWLDYRGPGQGLEVRMTFPVPIGGSGSFRDMPNVPTKEVMMRISGTAGLYTVNSIYPIRPGG